MAVRVLLILPHGWSHLTPDKDALIQHFLVLCVWQGIHRKFIPAFSKCYSTLCPHTSCFTASHLRSRSFSSAIRWADLSDDVLKKATSLLHLPTSQWTSDTATAFLTAKFMACAKHPMWGYSWSAHALTTFAAMPVTATGLRRPQPVTDQFINSFSVKHFCLQCHSLSIYIVRSRCHKTLSRPTCPDISRKSKSCPFPYVREYSLYKAQCPSSTVPNLYSNVHESKKFEIRAHSSWGEHKSCKFFIWAWFFLDNSKITVRHIRSQLEKVWFIYANEHESACEVTQTSRVWVW